ncbi:O-antigen ligase family protein, partial [Candidatus Sumerlaeota bacterium]|nr:O-antigen ligase family protein [Candidatus Sumerlaeota bacterium]
SMVYWVRLGCFLFFLLIILLTGARGAFIGLIVGSLFIVIVSLKTRRLILRKVHYFSFGTVIVALAVIVTIFSFPNPINVRNLNVLGRFKHLVDIRDDSIKERILFYGVCAEMIADHPVIGIGSGMFTVKFYPYIREMVERDSKAGMLMTLGDLKNRVPENAHNDFLQFWVEYGSLGFFAFLLAISSHLSATYTRLLHSNVPLKRSLLDMSLIGAVLCLTVNAAFSFPLHTPTRATLFWILFGLSHKMSDFHGTGCINDEKGKIS